VPRGKESKTAPLKPQAYKIGRMLCCGFCCGNMSKRDYKVATTDGIELEPLGGEKCEKDKDKDKEKQTNGVTFGESRPEFHPNNLELQLQLPWGHTKNDQRAGKEKCIIALVHNPTLYAILTPLACQFWGSPSPLWDLCIKLFS